MGFCARQYFDRLNSKFHTIENQTEERIADKKKPFYLKGVMGLSMEGGRQRDFTGRAISVIILALPGEPQETSARGPLSCTI
jgi:hypothetical protein